MSLKVQNKCNYTHSETRLDKKEGHFSAIFCCSYPKAWVSPKWDLQLKCNEVKINMIITGMHTLLRINGSILIAVQWFIYIYKY